MYITLNAVLGLSLTFFLAGCGEQTKSNQNPTLTPLRGHWTSARDNLHFADIQVEGSGITYYLPYEVRDEQRGNVTIQREIYQGSFTIEDKVETDRPNGKWVEGNLKIVLYRSSCAGVKPVQKEFKQAFALQWTGEGDTLRENFFWGRTSDPGVIHFQRYKEEDSRTAGEAGRLAKVKEVELGCYDASGAWKPNAKIGELR